MRRIRLVLLSCGVALFVALLIEIGPTEVMDAFVRLSWRLVIVLVFPFVVVTIFDTLGWRFAFGAGRVPFGKLLAARLAGEAFNATTPTASIGGEGVKALLVHPHAGLSQSVSSVIVAKTTITVSQVLFLFVALPVAGMAPEGGRGLITTMAVMLVVETLAVSGFVAAQVTSMMSRIGRTLAEMGVIDIGGPTSRRLDTLDAAVGGFYRRHHTRLALSIACHFLGWAFSAVEVYLILLLLGSRVSLATAIVIEGVGTAVRFASFMVPAHLGALEGGHVATFVALGMSASTGLSFSLVRRVREVFWIALGFIVLLEPKGKTPSPHLDPTGAGS